MVWSLPASLLTDILLIFMAQSFFAHKIHHLCRRQVKWLVTVPIMLFALVHFGLGMETAVWMFAHKEISSLMQIRVVLLTEKRCTG
ncbi:hypothetical protein BKA82DRAFT_4067547 [Pisolithus tinctorius]|nr:hypothetical protein BKA82DRAFT_4067547 [Pisolithus tinctorius]